MKKTDDLKLARELSVAIVDVVAKHPNSYSAAQIFVALATSVVFTVNSLAHVNGKNIEQAFRLFISTLQTIFEQTKDIPIDTPFDVSQSTDKPN